MSLLLRPAFPDGELVNGYLRRVSDLHENQSLALLCRRLLARKTGLDGMPSCLAEFHSSIGHLYCDVETLLSRHTYLDYYSCGLPVNRLGEQRARLLGKLRGPVRLCRLPVLFTPSEGEHLVCTECLLLSAHTYPFEFVHRNHVAPFVTVCGTHGRPLESPGTQGLLFDQLCRSSPTQRQLLCAIEFAKRTTDCIEGGLFGLMYQRENVRRALLEAGWIADGGRIHLAQLIEEFKLFFDSSFADERLALLLSSHDHVHNAIRALMRPDHALHPVWCILLVWFAQDCSYWQHRPSVRARQEQVRLPEDHEIAQLLGKHGSLNKVALEAGVDKHRLAMRCRLVGIAFTPRERHVDDSQLKAVTRLFEDGRRPAEIVRLTRMSSATVYRILGALPDLLATKRKAASRRRTDAAKRRWTSLCRANPLAGVANLRAKAPAVYAQLQRNACGWLSQHSPERARSRRRAGSKRAPQLVRTMSLAANLAATECSRRDRPPERRSRYRMQQKLGLSEYAFETTEHDARSTSLLQSRSEAIANSIDWASRRLPAGLGATLWRLGKAASLRTSTVRHEIKRRRGAS
ncbi:MULTISPECIES: TnsD family Tn7-like transposition protein [unclassified Caballeronia]|uniref:TnsD family Tn7-like transposition protein n=1 Tax=unclassified Caballeronia TaxID=2646786 RepID=UPI0038575FF8